jgi:hypothetical protein
MHSQWGLVAHPLSAGQESQSSHRGKNESVMQRTSCSGKQIRVTRGLGEVETASPLRGQIGKLVRELWNRVRGNHKSLGWELSCGKSETGRGSTPAFCLSMYFSTPMGFCASWPDIWRYNWLGLTTRLHAVLCIPCWKAGHMRVITVRSAYKPCPPVARWTNSRKEKRESQVAWATLTR